MKTKRITKCTSKDPEHLILDPPYTVFGTTPLPQSWCLTMRVGGLRQMLEDLKDEDTFRIEVFPDRIEYSYLKKGRSGLAD